MSRDARDGRESEVGDAGSPLLVDQNVRLCRRLGCECGDIPLGRQETYSFQISMDDEEVVHVLQAVRNAGQLNDTSVRLLQTK